MRRRRRVVSRGCWWRRGALALVLGTVTSLAVAWGLAAWMPLRGASTYADAMSVPDGWALEWVEIVVVTRPGAIRRSWRYRDEVRAYYGPAWLAAETRGVGRRGEPPSSLPWGDLPTLKIPKDRVARSRVRGMEDARGWPWPSLWCSMDDQGWGRNVTPPRITVKGGIALAQGNTARVTSANFRALPWWPVWLGFAADSAVYAGGWFLTFSVPVMLRRRYRIRYGHCPVCGYDLGGALGGGCPECGWGRESGKLKAESGKQK